MKRHEEEMHPVAVDEDVGVLLSTIEPKFKASAMGTKLFTRCRFCGVYAARIKQGQWGNESGHGVCSGCKGSLTRRLRSGKHGPADAKQTKERLRRTRYDWRTKKWIEGLSRHWYEYDWDTKRDGQGRPPLSPYTTA